MGGPARSWVSVICENALVRYLLSGDNAEALDGLFQRVDVHGLGQMRVHPGFLALLLDFYFTENKCKLFIRMNFFVFLIVFNVFRDSIDQFLYVNRLGNMVIHA